LRVNGGKLLARNIGRQGKKIRTSCKSVPKARSDATFLVNEGGKRAEKSDEKEKLKKKKG